MTTDSRLEELWRIKDDLAREAGYDIDRIFAELRAAEAQQPGPLIRSAEDLRRYSADRERLQEAASALALSEEPPPARPESITRRNRFDPSLRRLGRTLRRLLPRISPRLAQAGHRSGAPPAESTRPAWTVSPTRRHPRAWTGTASSRRRTGRNAPAPRPPPPDPGHDRAGALPHWNRKARPWRRRNGAPAR